MFFHPTFKPKSSHCTFFLYVFNMGACLSSPEEQAALRASREIERQMKEAELIEMDKVKLLLLGAGESGKSTIFKQMRILYGAPLTDEEKKQVTPVVYFNTIVSIQTLLEETCNMGYEKDVSHIIGFEISLNTNTK